jgi:predicted RNA-binding Zn-ribbon protein involved in translation (DUF1610 family)
LADSKHLDFREIQVKEYKAKNGNIQFKPSVEELTEMDEMGEGFCLACGNTQSAEPDAHRYECEACGEKKVYGAAELALMNLCY